mmetsp:Transcript_945/g.3088  ORF Transcript_945/g.3088 Transcript_945/m.3088 type:complete len:224 (-) Transcript_945:150-821(-)
MQGPAVRGPEPRDRQQQRAHAAGGVHDHGRALALRGQRLRGQRRHGPGELRLHARPRHVAPGEAHAMLAGGGLRRLHAHGQVVGAEERDDRDLDVAAAGLQHPARGPLHALPHRGLQPRPVGALPKGDPLRAEAVDARPRDEAERPLLLLQHPLQRRGQHGTDAAASVRLHALGEGGVEVAALQQLGQLRREGRAEEGHDAAGAVQHGPLGRAVPGEAEAPAE